MVLNYQINLQDKNLNQWQTSSNLNLNPTQDFNFDKLIPF